MAVIMRSATLGDIPAILTIEQQAPTAAHWSHEQYVRLIESGAVLVAEQYGHLTAFLCANHVGKVWEIENVVVSQELRRQGIANQLLLEFMNLAERALAERIVLEVRESNLPARSLYEKHGFRAGGRRRSYYRDPMEDAVLYSFQFGTRTRESA